MAESNTGAKLPSLETILKNDPLYLEQPLDTREAALFTNHPEPTLETPRCRGGGPVFIKRGKKVLYTRRALLEWLRAGERTSTSDPSAKAT